MGCRLSLVYNGVMMVPRRVSCAASSYGIDLVGSFHRLLLVQGKEGIPLPPVFIGLILK